jgi:predicted MPP superfamily phosphohydrolase
MIEKSVVSRRQFLAFLLTAVPSASIAYGVTTAPEQLRVSVNHLKLYGISVRFAHFTDLHYRGESSLTREVAREIQRIRPDFACFTGDLIESPDDKEGAFCFVRSLGCPVYAVPGNHDYTCGVPFREFEELFASTGGAWLENGNLLVPGKDLEIVGLAIEEGFRIPPPLSCNRILLTHFPQAVDGIHGAEFAAVLAGHSHGGQVRLPFIGPLFLPPGVGRYELGTFTTPAGSLYVNAGVGTSALPIRVCCPPELSFFHS